MVDDNDIVMLSHIILYYCNLYIPVGIILSRQSTSNLHRKFLKFKINHYTKVIDHLLSYDAFSLKKINHYTSVFPCSSFSVFHFHDGV